MASIKRFTPILVFIAPGLLLFGSGCMSVKCYVDPQFHDATYASIDTTCSPRPITLQVEYQVNGQRAAESEPAVRRKISQVLLASKTFYESSTKWSRAGQLQITVNNLCDVDNASRKATTSGLTFGLVGEYIEDRYEMTFTYLPPGGAAMTARAQHALHSTVGMHTAPKGMGRALPVGTACDQIVEDMLLNCLRDLQRQERL